MIIKGPYGNITILPVKVKDEQHRERREDELYKTLAKISYDIAMNDLAEGKNRRANCEVACTKVEN